MTEDFGLMLAFATGIGGAFHCLGMCGGMAAGVFMAFGGKAGILSHLLYHGVRITLYAVLGAAGAFMGSVLVQTGSMGKSQGILFILAGSGLVLFGLNMLRGVLSGWSAAVPPPGVLPVAFHEKMPNPSYIAAGGVFNGMVPCSLVFSVALKATATANPIDAALIMSAFGLGTLPAMILATSAGGLVSSFPQRPARIAAGTLVILFGLWTLYEGIVFYDIMRGLAG